MHNTEPQTRAKCSHSGQSPVQGSSSAKKEPHAQQQCQHQVTIGPGLFCTCLTELPKQTATKLMLGTSVVGTKDAQQSG